MLEHSSDQLAIPKTDFYCRGGERGREEEGGREGMGERKGEDGRESDNDTWDDSDDLEVCIPALYALAITTFHAG